MKTLIPSISYDLFTNNISNEETLYILSNSEAFDSGLLRRSRKNVSFVLYA